MRRKATMVGTRRLLAKNCLVCGHLRQAHQFGIRRNGYRESWCKMCKSRMTLEAYHANKEYKRRSM